MDKKRKYTKKNLNYWNGKTISEASVTESSEWAPLESFIGRNSESPSGISSGSCRSGPTTSSRMNRITLEDMPGEYKNISDLDIPFKTGDGGKTINIREIVLLCQKAYYRVSIFRNTVDVLTEFSNAPIYLTKGTKQSRDLVQEWFKKVKISKLSEQFFREYFRSGNVFIYTFLGKIKEKDIRELKKSFTQSATKINIPIRYTLLNPYDITLHSAGTISKGLYKKVLSEYDILKIKQKATPEDIQIFNSLPKEVKQNIENGNWNSDGIYIDLDPERLSVAFYKKQDYESFSVPFGYPVLSDINHKMEMKKIDRAISRTIQQVVLLTTMGNEPDKGGVNGKAMVAMRQLLENETVGRSIVSDYTTKMQFIIPEIGDILNPSKYQIVNEDIKEGLQNILFGSGEKFSNQQVKTKVFLERLKEGRKVFIEEFLQSQINNLCSSMGIKKAPEAKFQNIDLKDEAEMNRVFTRLLELGVLDPEQAFHAMETGILPDTEEMDQAQEAFIKKRREGKYVPLVGGSPLSDESSTEKKSGGPNPNSYNNGRPDGSKKPKSSVVGSEFKIGVSALKYSVTSFGELLSTIENSLIKKMGINEASESQKDFFSSLAENIFQKFDRKDWSEKVSSVCENPEAFLLSIEETPVSEKVMEIADKYEVDEFQASLIYHSLK